MLYCSFERFYMLDPTRSQSELHLKAYFDAHRQNFALIAGRRRAMPAAALPAVCGGVPPRPDGGWPLHRLPPASAFEAGHCRVVVRCSRLSALDSNATGPWCAVMPGTGLGDCPDSAAAKHRMTPVGCGLSCQSEPGLTACRRLCIGRVASFARTHMGGCTSRLSHAAEATNCV